uniref:NAC domain-containing protein n=1 Tax=Solanum lycopersicum TaxID=4081 RepID=A0A3Q7FJC6_SOLLC
MAANYTNKQLMEFLIKSFTFVPYEEQVFGLADLYGKEKVSQILGTNKTDHYVFTLLQKKKEDGKYFSRAIAGGVWKEYGTAESLEDSEGSQIGIMKKYRLVEDNYVWTMKEYSLTESKRNELKQKYQHTAHDEFVMCHIRMKANFPVSSSSQCQENQDSALVPSDDMKESQLPAVIEEECSVSVSQKKNALVHQETPSAKEEEHSVSGKVPLQKKKKNALFHQETPSVSYINLF